MNKSWLFLVALLIPHLTSCAQVEVSFDADNVARPRYIFDPSTVAATPLCPLTNLESYKQNTGVWCWAASVQMAINYIRAVKGQTPAVTQCDIVNTRLDIHPNPGDILNCCKAEDSYQPSSGELGNPEFDQMLQRCRVRDWPLKALAANGYDGNRSNPLNWEELTGQLCTKQTPYIFLVRFYDEYGEYVGGHTSVVGGARVTADGDKYVEVSDHSEDDFFLMKWDAFQAGVPGDFVHEADYINIIQLP